MKVYEFVVWMKPTKQDAKTGARPQILVPSKLAHRIEAVDHTTKRHTHDFDAPVAVQIRDVGGIFTRKTLDFPHHPAVGFKGVDGVVRVLAAPRDEQNAAEVAVHVRVVALQVHGLATELHAFVLSPHDGTEAEPVLGQIPRLRRPVTEPPLQFDGRLEEGHGLAAVPRLERRHAPLEALFRQMHEHTNRPPWLIVGPQRIH